MVVTYSPGIHQYGATEYADRTTQRFPLGTERTDRSLGLSEESAEAIRRKYLPVLLIIFQNI